MCSHPERDFPYFAEVTPPLEEALLIPFYVRGEALGTIWVVSHDDRRRFDAEDLRVMTSLGAFAAAAYQTLLSLNVTRQTASIVDSSDDAIVGKDLDGVITSWNSGAERIFGYAAQEVIGRPVTILIPPGRQDEELGILERLRRGERIDHYETVRQRKDGSLIDVWLTVSPIRNAQGKITGASKIARDISERKRSQEQITFLAREAEHRAKNALATVQAIVRLSQADTPEGLKHAIEGRLQALANVHELFAGSRWAGAEIRNLVEEELAAYSQGRETQVQVGGPKLLLEPNAAQAIAMTLHELTTNAAKYGALSVPDGHVQVEWSRAPDGRLVLALDRDRRPAGQAVHAQGFRHPRDREHDSRPAERRAAPRLARRRPCVRDHLGGVRSRAVRWGLAAGQAAACHAAGRWQVPRLHCRPTGHPTFLITCPK